MEPRSKKARFGEVSEDPELQAFDARTPMSTKTATTFWLGVFESFCVEKEIVLDLKKSRIKASAAPRLLCSS